MKSHRQHRRPPAPPRQKVLGLVMALVASTSVHAADIRHPVVVELFTSQGCSSCPPANDNLARLTGRPDVIALSFGVTYWDQLGWKDTFASRQYTERQWAYARQLRHDNVWTPQVVVNGRADTVGVNRADIDSLIRSTGVAEAPAVQIAGPSVQIGQGRAPGAPADVLLVRYEPGVIDVPVRRGENTGRTLPHSHVVRSLVRLGAWTGAPVRFQIPQGDPRLGVAVLVQSAGTGPILAAASSQVSVPG